MQSPAAVEHSASNVSVGSEPADAKRKYRFRWWPALVVLVVGISAQQAAWWSLDPDRTMQVFSVMATSAATWLGLNLWWLFGSGLRWRTRFLGIFALVLLGGVWFGTVRLEGFSGEMIPRLAWRWNKTAEARAEEFLNSVQAAPAKADPADGAATVPPTAPLVVTDEDWPEYRGRNRDGVVLHSSLRRDWDANPPKLLWKHPAGPGWSSFAIVGELAFTQEQRRNEEVVICLEAETGKELWVHADPVRYNHPMGGDGPRCTPTVNQERVYSVGATGILNCLEARTGKKVWSHDILTENQAENTEWGTSDSPLIYENLVVVNPGGPKGQGVVAFDRLTGDQVWSAGNDPASYASPQISRLDGEDQILIFDAVGLAGHDIQTGEQLWKFPWTNGPKVNAAQPIILGEDRVFLGNGYAVGSAVIQVKHEGANWSATPVWETKQLKLKFNCAVEHGGFVYGLDEGILSCFNAIDGKRQWKGGRYGYGQLLVVEDLILVQAESGEVALVNASAEKFTELCRFPAIEGKSWSHPVLCRGRLFVRNAQEAACYDVSPGSERVASRSE